MDEMILNEPVLRLQARPGLVEDGEYRLFHLFSAKESLGTADALHGKISARRFCPLGTFICGDIVCVLDDGKLFVVLHDDFEVIESGVDIGEFADRLEALDRELEEDVYTRERPVLRERDAETKLKDPLS